MATSELEDHDQSAAGLKVVVADLHLISQLLATENKTDLVDLDSLALLKGILDVKDSVVELEVEVLFLACQSLYNELHVCFSYLYYYN